MSYRIDHVHIIRGKLRCDRETFEGLKCEFGDRADTFAMFDGEFDDFSLDGKYIEFDSGFDYSGSSRSLIVFMDILLAMEGSADLVLVCDGGRFFEGLRKTLFGTIESMEVRFVLE